MVGKIMRGNSMGKRLGAALAAVFGLGALASAATADPVRVKIDTGILVGADDAGVVAFKGVPYVAAPMGDLRWAPPKPAKPWTGERPATAYAPVCPQTLYPTHPNGGGAMGPSSEDCLYLNVWTAKTAHKLPVMVWLHGGANEYGAGSLGAYDGSAFVHDGVILVTINYRLGAFGFFAHPALTKAAGAGEPLANYAIMDQIAALQWVRRNIEACGGDPRNVTLFGESAGGADTLTVMGAHAATGLYAKVIVESGGGWSPPDTLAKAETAGDALMRKAGAPANATLAQLRALSPDALVAAGGRFGPIVDGRLLTESPSQAIARGHIAAVPIMIGSNSFEASLMKAFGIPPTMMLATVPAAVKAAYADLPDDTAKANAIFTDAVMGGPARWVAAHPAGGQPAYLYHFSYVLDAQRPTSQGAGHASELPYVFDSWDKLGPNGEGVKVSTADAAIAKLVHSCWSSFAKDSKPTCMGAPAWPAYTPAADTLMEFDQAPHLVTHFRKARLDVQEARALPTLDGGK
jgi:para-nitrobenzyl esterase